MGALPYVDSASTIAGHGTRRTTQRYLHPDRQSLTNAAELRPRSRTDLERVQRSLEAIGWPVERDPNSAPVTQDDRDRPGRRLAKLRPLGCELTGRCLAQCGRSQICWSWSIAGLGNHAMFHALSAVASSLVHKSVHNNDSRKPALFSPPGTDLQSVLPCCRVAVLPCCRVAVLPCCRVAVLRCVACRRSGLFDLR
jgi:hypothetical protein